MMVISENTKIKTQVPLITIVQEAVALLQHLMVFPVLFLLVLIVLLVEILSQLNLSINLPQAIKSINLIVAPIMYAKTVIIIEILIIIIKSINLIVALIMYAKTVIIIEIIIIIIIIILIVTPTIQ